MSSAFSHLDHGEVTDVGRKRKNNEDAFAAFPEHGFFCVADGMGGAADGEIASAAAVEELRKLFADFPPSRPLSLRAKLAWVQCALDDASAWIFRRSCLRGKSGTGTTFAGVAFDPVNPSAAVAIHAGDSRVYKFGSENGAPVLCQLTTDHSVANMVGGDEKLLNPAFRNMISKALGLAPSVKCEQTRFDVAPGDFVLICSDGLDKMVSNSAIAALLSDSANAEDAAKKLVDAALNAGGGDNVTVIVVKIGSMAQAAPLDTIRDEMPKIGGFYSASSNADTSPSTRTTEDKSSLEAGKASALQAMPSSAPASARRRFLAAAAALIAVVSFFLGFFAFKFGRPVHQYEEDWNGNQTIHAETIAPAAAPAAPAVAAPPPPAKAVVEVRKPDGVELVYSPADGEKNWEEFKRDKPEIELETGEWLFQWRNGDFQPEDERRWIRNDENEPLAAPAAWSPAPALAQLINLTNACAIAREKNDPESWSVVTNLLSLPDPDLAVPFNKDVWNAQKDSARVLSTDFFKAGEEDSLIKNAKGALDKIKEIENAETVYDLRLPIAFEVLCENYGYKYGENGLDAVYTNIWKKYADAIADAEKRIDELPDDTEGKKAAIKKGRERIPFYGVLGKDIEEDDPGYDEIVGKRMAEIKAAAKKIQEINAKLEKENTR